VIEPWPEPVERVAAVLRSRGVEARLEAFTTPTPTAADAARAVGCELGQIVKSLVFDCDGRAAVAMVPGDRRADPHKVAAAAGAAVARVAGPAEVERVTGFAPGAVAPFPLPNVWHVFIEQLLLGRDVVWVGAGSSSHLAALSPADLMTLSRAQPADLVEDDT
jgi:prolyl-tRNA editing enzyme YbaK/EbsC (Cys-tRNA(Pro) deacylase)